MTVKILGQQLHLQYPRNSFFFSFLTSFYFFIFVYRLLFLPSVVLLERVTGGYIGYW